MKISKTHTPRRASLDVRAVRRGFGVRFGTRGPCGLAAAVLFCAACAVAAPRDGRWVNETLVIVSPGVDAMGGRVPGHWHPFGRARIAVSRERAFTGKSSLKIRLDGPGGCRRILTVPGGKFRMVFSCRIFAPEGQSFDEMPSVRIWGAHEVIAKGRPIERSGEWTQSAIEMDRPPGRLFYFGVWAAPRKGSRAVFYVDRFLLRNKAESLNWLPNPDFEQDASDKRAKIIADFQPDLLNVWTAARLNKDGLFHKHGVRVASWGKVEYDACIDWDKRLEEFKKTAACRDIDGKVVPRKGYPPFTYRMCHHSPVWHEYQKSGLLRILDENDALGQDNLCNPTFRGPKDQCYCPYCQRDFRIYLKKRFSPEQLARMLPCPVEKFSIADYIKRIRPTRPGFKLLDDPAAREFVRAQYIAGKGFIADLAASIRRKARERNRVVPFFGNQGSAWGGTRFPVFSVVISDIVDAQCLEDDLHEPYRRTSRSAWGTLQYRLMRAVTLGRKPVWPLLDVGRFRKWPTAARLFPARALSQGAVPMLIWSPLGWPDQTTYQAHARYARFINANRALFLNRRPAARVALVYSVPTCFWRYFYTYWIYWRAGSRHDLWLGPTARVLEDAHILYEPVVFGHPDLLDDREQLVSLDPYEVLALVDVDCVSDRQAAAVRRFARRGGRVVIVGQFGTRTEDYVPRKRSVLDDLRSDPALADRIVVLPADRVKEFRNLKTPDEKAERAFTALRDALRPAHPLIETNAPRSLTATLWRDAAGGRISLHLVNRNVDLKRHAFRPATDVWVRLRAPADFRFDRVRLLTPDGPASDLPFEREGEMVRFRVPSVECYAIAALTTGRELDAANLIAAARRSIDRARVAGRTPEKAALIALAEAERLYEMRRYAEAEQKAKTAIRAAAIPTP